MPSSDCIEEIGALATMVDENRFSYSLDALCAWRGLPGKDETLLRQGIQALGLVKNKRKKLRPQEHIWQLPARYVAPYAEADAINTLALFESLDPVLDQEGTRDAYRLECDILPMVQEMRLRGIRVDLDAADRVRDLLERKRDAALTELSGKLGYAVSMHELRGRKWLVETFDSHNIKYPTTEKGNPSFKAGKMGWMGKHVHWLPQLITAANKYDKAVSDFVQKLIDHAVNGRVHAEINPHRSENNGTKSFRFSYSDPPLQQMPKHDKELAPLIRGLFLPEEGEVWATPDASQQEFRLVVHYAAQHKLNKADEAVALYRGDPNTDFHAFAAMITGLDRSAAKAVNFAKIYGAGVEKFALMIGKPLAEAKQIYERYDRELPFLYKLSKIYSGRAHAHGFITLYGDARRHFNRFAPGGKWAKGAGPCELDEARRRLTDPDHPWYKRGNLYRADAYTALNALIQGSAAHHTKLWMRACWREGIVPLLQMHDCLECSVSSREQAERVAQLGAEAVHLDVPMKIDLKFGRTWGDAQHGWDDLTNGTPTAAAPSSTIAVAAPVTIQPEPESAGAHADVDMLELLCVHCQAPIGTDRIDAYNDGWLHPECCDPYLKRRFMEEGIEWESETVSVAAELATAATAAETTDARHGSEDSRRPVDPGIGHGDASPDQLHRPDLAGVSVAGGIPAANGDRADHPAPGGDGAAAGAAVGDGHTPSNSYHEPKPDSLYEGTRAGLWKRGYRLASTFAYMLPGGRVLYSEDRYELAPGIAPGSGRPRKEYRFWHHDGGQTFNSTGPAEQRIIYNWQAILEAGPGATVHITEGARKADALIAKGLLATAVAYHSWNDRCINALRGLHLIYHEDRDPPNKKGIRPGEKYSADARDKLAPVAASFRILPARQLWENLSRNGEPPPGWDIKDWLDAGGDRATLLKICEQIPAEGTETIEPIDLWGQFDPPPLPTGLLPEVIEQFARQEGELMGADPCGLAMAALTVCAAALPDHTQIQVKRHDPNWLEAARLWTGLIGPPSTKKTPIMLRATKPLKRLDADLWRSFLAAQEHYEQLSAEERKQVERPRQTRLRLEDTTIEAAQEILKNSPDGVLCIQDELAGWFGAMDKYAGRGAAKDRGFWLQSFHGGPSAVNRIARGAAMIENLSVSLLGGIQPDPIRKIAADTIDDGLLQRLMPIVLCRGRVGKDAPTSQAATRYNELVEWLRERERPPAPLQFNDGAL